MQKNKRTWHKGRGPLYVGLSIMITSFAMLIDRVGIFAAGVVPQLLIPSIILGILFTLLGIYIWVQAVIISKINKHVDENKLVTTGIYAWVRNPIYTGITFVLMGSLCFVNNLFLLPVPLLYWLLMSIIVRSEEHVLEKKFGEAYLEYKRKVNRCVPWFPQK